MRFSSTLWFNFKRPYPFPSFYKGSYTHGPLKIKYIGLSFAIGTLRLEVGYY